MPRFLRSALICAALSSVSVAALAATTTTPYALNNTAYTDLGVGPMLLGAVGGDIVYQIADSQPSIVTAGMIQKQNASPAVLTAVSAHVWARAVTGASAVVSSGTGVTGGGGGGGGGSVTQGTSPWVVSWSAQTVAATQSGTWNIGSITTLPSVTLTGTLPAYAATPTFNIGTIGTAATAANQTSVQSAPGTPQTTAITVQGNASGVAIPVSMSATPTGAATAANQATEISSLATIATNSGTAIPIGANVIGKVGIDQTTPGTTNLVATSAASGDPCNGSTAHASAAFAITSATQTSLVAAVSAKKIYICSLTMITGAANNANFYDVAAAGACSSAATDAVIGASSNAATNGLNFAANGGLTFGNGGGMLASTPTANSTLCVVTSSAGPFSGVLTYVQQ